MTSATKTSHRPDDLPEYASNMIINLGTGNVQIIGLPLDAGDPTFTNRAAAKDWLTVRWPKLNARMKRGPRACMSCKASFISEGPHNRLCSCCRRGASE